MDIIKLKYGIYTKIGIQFNLNQESELKYSSIFANRYLSADNCIGQERKNMRKLKVNDTSLYILGINSQEKTKPEQLQSPKKGKNKIIKPPRSLSPLESGSKQQTLKENISKASLYLYPSNYSNIPQNAVNESSLNPIKKPLRSANFHRNLLSSQRQREQINSSSKQQRTSSEKPPRSFFPLITNLSPHSTKNSFSHQQKPITPFSSSQSQKTIPNYTSYSKLLPLPFHLPLITTRSTSFLNANTQKNVSFNDSPISRIDTENEQPNTDQIERNSYTPGFVSQNAIRRKNSSKNIQPSLLSLPGMGGKLQPIFEEVSQQRPLYGGGSSSKQNDNWSSQLSIQQTQISFDSKQNIKGSQNGTVTSPLFFTRNDPLKIAKKNMNQVESENEGLRGENARLQKEMEMLRMSLNQNSSRKFEELERLQQDNDKLRNELSLLRQSQTNQQNGSKQIKLTTLKEMENIRFQSEVKGFKEMCYEELLMQLGSLRKELTKPARNQCNDDHYEASLNEQFEHLVMDIQSAKNFHVSNVKNGRAQWETPLRYFPPNLISFDHNKRICKGGFGSVYKVSIGDSNEMAQKVFEHDIDECLAETLSILFGETRMLIRVASLSSNAFVRLRGLSFDIRKSEMNGKDSLVFALFTELIGRYDTNGSFHTCDLRKYIATTKERSKSIQQDPHKNEQNKQNLSNYKLKLELSLQISEAVEILYSNQIVHSDLKPQNILINHDQSVKIIDFGISKFNHHKNTHDTCIFGFSPRYCPLEQFDMQQLTPTTDVWSLGCLLLEIFTAQEPWKGIKNTHDFRQALENKQSLWLHYLNSLEDQKDTLVPPQIAELIQQCTSYSDRPHPSFVTKKLMEFAQIL